MAIVSQNPSTGEIIKKFDELTENEIQQKIQTAEIGFLKWRESSIDERASLLKKFSELLTKNKEEIARLASLEVGQPIKAAIGEIEKCSATANYYSENLEKFLKDDIVKTEFTESYIKYEPLGVILGIAPWNFPFWMAFRFIIPTISAGNVVLLKHASNVPQCALKIEEIMLEAGFPRGICQIMLISSSKIENIIKNDSIKAVSFSGSENSGSIVAVQAAREIKKTLLELGGSDPFIVMDDADLPTCAKSLTDGRLRNAGQACNSPKRLFIHKKVEEELTKLVIQNLKNTKLGDPLDMATEIGPLANKTGLEEVQRQVDVSIRMGAKLLLGGKKIEGKGLFYEPTILTNVKPGMPAFDEEIFGPIVSIITFNTLDEAVELANNTKYGLGASIWSKDIENAKKYISKLEAGNVFINQPVRSDPRLPYGGIKHSGYGRELSSYGIKEFVNIKTVVIK